MGVALDGWWDCHSLCQRQLQQLHSVAVPFTTGGLSVFKCTHVWIKKGVFFLAVSWNAVRGERPHAAIHQSMIHRPLLDDAVQVGAAGTTGGVSAMMRKGEQIGQSSETWQVSFLKGMPHRWTDPPANPPAGRPVSIWMTVDCSVTENTINVNSKRQPFTRRLFLTWYPWYDVAAC